MIFGDILEKIQESLLNLNNTIVDFSTIDISKLKFNYDSEIYVSIPLGVEIPELSVIGPMHRYLMSVRNILKYLDEGLPITIVKEEHLENIYILGTLYNTMLIKRQEENKIKYGSMKPLDKALKSLAIMMKKEDLLQEAIMSFDERKEDIKVILDFGDESDIDTLEASEMLKDASAHIFKAKLKENGVDLAEKKQQIREHKQFIAASVNMDPVTGKIRPTHKINNKMIKTYEENFTKEIERQNLDEDIVLDTD